MPVQLNAFQADVPMDENKKVVTDPYEFERMVKFLEDKPAICFDFETSGTAWYKHARGCGLALASWDDRGDIYCWYTPYRHNTGERQLDFNVISPAFKRLLEFPDKLYIAHNFVFDDHMARREGWFVQGKRYDTMVAAHISDENSSMALKNRAVTELGHKEAVEWDKTLSQHATNLAKANKMGKKEYLNRYGYSQIPIYLCGLYACWDVEFTLELFRKYEYETSEPLSDKYKQIVDNEMALTEVICDIEEYGLPLDVGYVHGLKQRVTQAQRDIEAQLFTGRREINLSSDEAVRNYVKDDLKIKLTKKTKKEQLSVDRDALEPFIEKPEVKLILDWRDANKIDTTYTDTILKHTDDKNILHGSLLSCGTNTGRLSSRAPNYQNFASDDHIRAKGNDGIDPWSVKRAFHMGDRKVRLFYDLSQIELRVLGFYAQDPIMIDTFIKGEDAHSRTSLEVFGSAEPHFRKRAKAINFGLNYCLSSKGLARQLKTSEEEAQSYLEQFFERYNTIEPFREKFWGEARANKGHFTNLFGRPRRIPTLNSYSPWEQGRAERQAIGSLIQGTAAEITKIALVRIHKELKERKLPAIIVNTVHDEIQVDCLDASCIVEVGQIMKWAMESFPQFHPIPITVDGEYTTTNWAEKKPLP